MKNTKSADVFPILVRNKNFNPCEALYFTFNQIAEKHQLSDETRNQMYAEFREVVDALRAVLEEDGSG